MSTKTKLFETFLGALERCNRCNVCAFPVQDTAATILILSFDVKVLGIHALNRKKGTFMWSTSWDACAFDRHRRETGIECDAAEFARTFFLRAFKNSCIEEKESSDKHLVLKICYEIEDSKRSANVRLLKQNRDDAIEHALRLLYHLPKITRVIGSNDNGGSKDFPVTSIMGSSAADDGHSSEHDRVLVGDPQRRAVRAVESPKKSKKRRRKAPRKQARGAALA